MTSVFYEEVISLVDKLTPEEQQSVVRHVLDKPKKKKLSAEEFQALFESLVVDLGEMLPGYSDRREDWYNDDGR